MSGKGGKGRAAVPVDRHAASLTSAVRVQKAYAFAASQFQSIGMMGFMMYMSGNGVQIFSIMVTLGGIFNPIKAILRSGKTFERFADEDGRDRSEAGVLRRAVRGARVGAVETQRHGALADARERLGERDATADAVGARVRRDHAVS